jgi:hypothetical protein
MWTFLPNVKKYLEYSNLKVRPLDDSLQKVINFKEEIKYSHRYKNLLQ